MLLANTAPGGDQYDEGALLFTYRHCIHCASSLTVEPPQADVLIGPAFAVFDPRATPIT